LKIVFKFNALIGSILIINLKHEEVCDL
jgi:hypothetical protein